jgi:hypothetical protein
MENIQDEILGELFWEEKHRWWKGEARLNSDLPFKIYLFEYPKDKSESIEPYQRFFETICRNEPKAREFAADELLAVYNENWNGSDKPITKEEFCRRMRLESIGIYDIYDGADADFHYESEDLFGEHTLVVTINESGVFTYAEIEG